LYSVLWEYGLVLEVLFKIIINCPLKTITDRVPVSLFIPL